MTGTLIFSILQKTATLSDVLCFLLSGSDVNDIFLFEPVKEKLLIL